MVIRERVMHVYFTLNRSDLCMRMKYNLQLNEYDKYVSNMEKYIL